MLVDEVDLYAVEFTHRSYTSGVTYAVEFTQALAGKRNKWQKQNELKVIFTCLITTPMFLHNWPSRSPVEDRKQHHEQRNYCFIFMEKLSIHEANFIGVSKFSIMWNIFMWNLEYVDKVSSLSNDTLKKQRFFGIYSYIGSWYWENCSQHNHMIARSPYLGIATLQIL